jgi:hypothetical protein
MSLPQEKHGQVNILLSLLSMERKDGDANQLAKSVTAAMSARLKKEGYRTQGASVSPLLRHYYDENNECSDGAQRAKRTRSFTVPKEALEHIRTSVC